ncbi:hypothetical protein [Microvirga brassicacearum]|uniref:Uncharacterized protein n=1 Tax=Microvirga brassicacearum TaxID=2580413 RepID=A0A5N3PBH2_9HYPH|nr:hypothetical protein [Microvirga brassicacearum]KAB0267098.1 hypothetical protein FEZ63_11785 [Microvirga brassicacearum]
MANGYHVAPDPSAIPELLRTIGRARRSGGISHPAPILGFLSGVFEQNPGRISAMLSEWHALDEVEQAIVLKALLYARKPEASNFIKGVWSDRMLSILKQDLRDPRSAPSPDLTVVNNPGDLDFLWGRFFGTGGATPVRTIIKATKLKSRRADPENVATGLAAAWSLASNAGRYDRVLAICKETLKSADPATISILEDIVAKAEQRRSAAGS